MTPMVPVDVFGELVLAKMEKFNPSGSHKDRPARLIVRSLLRSGNLPGRLIVSSSGNFANAVAYHTQGEGVGLTVVTDVLSPPAFAALLRTYPHVDVRVVDNPDASGSHLAARLKLIERLREATPTAVVIDQYTDRRLPIAYEESLAREVVIQAGDTVGAVFVPVGTGATLSGLLRYRARNGMHWPVFAVDADGSNLFRCAQGVKRRLSGYGNAGPTKIVSELAGEPYYVVHVSDSRAVDMCHRAWQRDRLSVGPSSGATLSAVARVLERRPDLLPHTGPIVAILPDGGQNYASTVFDEGWLSSVGLSSVPAV